MLTTSAAFKNAIASEDREIRAYLKFNGSTILRGVDGLVSIEWDQSVYDEERLCIGCAVSSFITAEFFDNLTGVDFKNSYVEAFVGVVLEDTGTAPSGSIEPDTATVEYVSLGRFDITDSVTKNGKTVITAYDKLSKLSGEYTPSISAGTNGYAIADIVNDVLTQSGVGGSVSGSYGYVQKIQASTYREQLKYCLTMMVQNGSSYILDRTNDSLKMTSVIGQDATQLTITDSTTYIDGMDEQPSFTISSLQATTGTDVYTFGSGQGIEISNPYITNAQASAIYNSMEGFSYLPIRLEFRGNPAIDPGDVLTLTAGGKNTKVVAMRIRSTFNGGFKSTIDCYGNTETYYAMSESPTATRITQAENMIRLEAERATTAEGNLSAQITINADSISSEVTRATEAEGALSTAITQTAGEVSIVAQKLDNIGGRNLLAGTSADEQTFSPPSSGYTDFLSWVTTTPIYKTTYTLSFWAKSTVDGDTIRTFFYNPNISTVCTRNDGYTKSAIDGYMPFTLTTSWAKYWVTWVQSSPVNAVKKVMGLRLYATDASGTISVMRYKFEEGSVATDWTPAPEDKTSNNEIIAKINVSPENITISANKVDLQGYVTFTNLSTSGQTAINGGNITTGLIQDQAGKNSWNLNTGAFTITEGTINITTNSETFDAIALQYLHYTNKYSPIEWRIRNTTLNRMLIGQSTGVFGYILNGDTETQSAILSAAGDLILGSSGSNGYIRLAGDSPSMAVLSVTNGGELALRDSSGVAIAELGGIYRQIALYDGAGSLSLRFTNASRWLTINNTANTRTVLLNGAAGGIDISNGTQSLSYTAGSSLSIMNGANKVTARIWPDSNGAGRLVLGDGTSTLWRISLTNDGLTFRDANDNVTARYPNSLTASRVLVTSSGKVVTASSVTSTELGYVSGVTSAIQTQLNGKQATISTTEGTITFASGWTNADPTVTSGSLRYTFLRKYGNVVEVCCSCNTSNAYSNWHQIATLPSGFRPTKTFTIHGYNNTDDSNAIFRILSSGEVSVYGDKRQPTLHATFVI